MSLISREITYEEIVAKLIQGAKVEMPLLWTFCSCVTQEQVDAINLELSKEEGREEGREEVIFNIVRKKIAKGKSVAEISEVLEISEVAVIRLIEKYNL